MLTGTIVPVNEGCCYRDYWMLRTIDASTSAHRTGIDDRSADSVLSGESYSHWE
jgi:hypothetical protein